MKDSTLLTIALACSFVGIVSLYLISQYTTIEEKSVYNITDDDLDKTVRIAGKVLRVTQKEKVTFLDIEQCDEITAVVFENVSIGRGEHIVVQGKVSEYNGEYEVVADQIHAAR